MIHGHILKGKWQCKCDIYYICIMTTIQLRSEIHKAIDNLPDKALVEILDQIHVIQQPSVDKEKIMRFIEKVFQEDDGLLRRLAQ